MDCGILPLYPFLRYRAISRNRFTSWIPIVSYACDFVFWPEITHMIWPDVKACLIVRSLSAAFFWANRTNVQKLRWVKNGDKLWNGRHQEIFWTYQVLLPLCMPVHRKNVCKLIFNILPSTHSHLFPYFTLYFEKSNGIHILAQVLAKK